MKDAWHSVLPLPVVTKMKAQNPGVSIADEDKFFESVKVLDLSGSRFSVIPPFIKKMKNLIHLDLSFNYIENVDLDRLPDSLWYLNMTGNEIKEFNVDSSRLPNLTTLNLTDNYLERFPKGLDNLERLSTIIIKNNKIGKIDEEFVIGNRVSMLDLSSNKISSFKVKQNSLNNCSTLHISNNEMEKFPSSLLMQKNLRYVHALNNQFEDWSFLARAVEKGITVNV